MKREMQERYDKPIGRCFPVIEWRWCIVCKKEFKFELGYWFHWGFYGKPSRAFYLCGHCCNSLAEAQTFALNFQGAGHTYSKPAPPPPPPPRKK